MKRTLYRALLAGLCLVSVACSIPHSISVTVSFSDSGASRGQLPGRQIQVQPLNVNQFKANRLPAARGALVGSYSPSNFLLDLDRLILYTSSGAGYTISELLSFRERPPNNAIIPRHVDLVNNRNFIRDVSIGGSHWQGIGLAFLPFGSGFTDNDMYVKSSLSVRLGSNYNGVWLPGQVGIDAVDPTIHWFGFDSLQPLNCSFLSYVTVGSDISTPGIQNPGGTMPPNGVWDLGGLGTTSGNATSIFLPGPDIEFAGYTNPEIVLMYQMNGLIEVYDNNTPALYGDDIVTLNLSDPFPVSLEIREHSGSGSGPDSTPPGDVLFLHLSGSGNNTLQWVNPQDSDFDKVVVVRKAGSDPVDRNDGSVVYSSYEPNFCDTSGIPGTDYHYRVFSVDFSGNWSSGVVGNKVF